MCGLLKKEYIMYGVNAYNFHGRKTVDVEAAAAAAPPPAAAATGTGAAAGAPPAKTNAFGVAEDEEVVVKVVAPPTVDVRRAHREQLEKDLGVQFDRVHRNYVIFCQNLKWEELFPELELPADGDYDLIDDLIEADIVTKVIGVMVASFDPTCVKFGFLRSCPTWQPVQRPPSAATSLPRSPSASTARPT